LLLKTQNFINRFQSSVIVLPMIGYSFASSIKN
jgi:hypothetical protein